MLRALVLSDIHGEDTTFRWLLEQVWRDVGPIDYYLCLGDGVRDFQRVEGFIRHGGRDFLCSGCWKVYDNACEAQRLFARYHKCRRVYADAFASGIPLRRLAVATVC